MIDHYMGWGKAGGLTEEDLPCSHGTRVTCGMVEREAMSVAGVDTGEMVACLRRMVLGKGSQRVVGGKQCRSYRRGPLVKGIGGRPRAWADAQAQAQNLAHMSRPSETHAQNPPTLSAQFPDPGSRSSPLPSASQTLQLIHQVPFARYLAMNGITSMKRYHIGKV